MGRLASLTGVLVNSVSVGTGVTQTVDFDCAGARRVWILARLSGTTTPGDLTFAIPRPYLPASEAAGDICDSGTILFVEAGSATPAAVGSNIEAAARFYIGGLSKVRFRFTNNNAGSKTLDVWFLVDKTDT